MMSGIFFFPSVFAILKSYLNTVDIYVLFNFVHSFRQFYTVFFVYTGEGVVGWDNDVMGKRLYNINILV